MRPTRGRWSLPWHPTSPRQTGHARAVDGNLWQLPGRVTRQTAVGSTIGLTASTIAMVLAQPLFSPSTFSSVSPASQVPRPGSGRRRGHGVRRRVGLGSSKTAPRQSLPGRLKTQLEPKWQRRHRPSPLFSLQIIS